jgi:hypothetical protein
MAGKKKRMTMNRAATILRESGWRVDVDKASRRIVLQNPLPDVNWLHVLRQEVASEVESMSGSADDTVSPERRGTR